MKWSQGTGAGTRPNRFVGLRGERHTWRRVVAFDAPLIRRTLHIVLWGAVAAGALGGLVAVMRHTTTAARPRPTQASSAAPTRVDGFAELFVSAYLGAGSASEASLAPFFTGNVDLSQVSAGSQYVTRTSIADERQLEPDYWSVTVAAEVLEQKAGRYGTGALRYFNVGVYVGGDGNPVATAPPAEVPAAARGTAPSLALSDLAPPDPSDPLQATAQQFLAALLCGQGDISRVESPGVSISAVGPAPLSSVELTGVAEATSAGSSRLTALVSGTTTAGNTVVLEYQLDLRQRAGRWEVTAMSGAPALANESQAATRGSMSPRAPAPHGQSLAPMHAASVAGFVASPSRVGRSAGAL